MMKRLMHAAFLILMLFLYPAAYAQIFSDIMPPTQDPFCVTWKEIETEHFRVIFPSDVEKEARQVANTMEHLYSAVHYSLPADEKKTPIILRMNLTESNGYASLAPRRSEWYNTPPQRGFAGVAGWYDMLGLHEYRHMVQFDSLDHGMNTWGRYLFGEEMYMGLIFMSVPTWYYEGDSVLTETCLSRGGRGRTPAFDVELRTLLLNGKRHDYYKAMLGSYDDYDPLSSPYLLGYFMNTHIRTKYGADALVRANRRTSYLSIVPYRHTFAVKHITGKHTSDVYEDVMDEMTDLWKNQLQGLALTEVKTIASGPEDEWSKYLTPRDLGNGRMACLHYGMYDMMSIVVMDRATGKTVSEIDAAPSDMMIGGASGRVVWAESVPDERWGLVSSNDIYMHDVAKDRTVRLTRGGRYHAPSLSPDGKTIVAVEYTGTNMCSLVIIDANSGRIISRYSSPDNDFIQTPSWTSDGKGIVYCAINRSRGKAVYMFDPASKSRTELLPYGYENYTHPVSDGKYVFYSSEYSGIDTLYALQIDEGKKYQVACRPYGAYSPSLTSDASGILFNDVGAKGFDAAYMPVDPSTWKPIDEVEVRRVNYFEPVMSQEKGYALENIPDNEYEVKDYSGIKTAFSVHSWYPMVSPLSRDISIAVKSTNLLGSMGARVGYIYNWNENAHAGLATLSYAGMYPIFDLNGIVGTRGSTYSQVDALGRERTKFYSWMEKSGGMTVRLPFNFSRGLTMTNFEMGVRGDVVSISDQPVRFKNTNNNGLFTPITYYMTFDRLTQWTYDINPRWGQVLNLYYSHTPFKTDYHGQMLSSTATFFFPGIFRSNSLYFEGAFEYQDGDEYHYSSRILFPRGYEYEYNGVFTKGSINYTFPLLHPDANLYIVYIRRIYLNMFHDMGIAFDGGDRDYYRSAGAEFMFDISPIALPVSISVGLRWSFLFDNDEHKRNNFGLAISSLSTTF